MDTNQSILQEKYLADLYYRASYATNEEYNDLVHRHNALLEENKTLIERQAAIQENSKEALDLVLVLVEKVAALHRDGMSDGNREFLEMELLRLIQNVRSSEGISRP